MITFIAALILLPLSLTFLYVTLVPILASFVAALQERKIWKAKPLPSLSAWGFLKVFFFNILWMELCLIGCAIIAIKGFFFQGANYDIAADCFRFVESNAAKICIWTFVGDCKVEGTENLPPVDRVPAPVYIANHISQIDTGVVYFLERRFKWVAKKSVLYLPGPGQVMALGNHVLINRTKGKNKKSVDCLFEKSNASVQSGIPMFFFPQGTRWMAERYPFKDGAFIVAETNQSVLVPISIDIPMDAWNSWYPLSLLWRSDRPTVKLTVHKAVTVKGGPDDRERLKKECFDQIYSVLPTFRDKKE